MNIKSLHILSHHYKISSRIDIFAGFPYFATDEGVDVELINNVKVVFKTVGQITPSSNQHSNFRARELQSVAVDLSGVQYIKFIFHQNHINQFNIWNQVCVMSVSVIGSVGPHTQSVETNMTEETKESEEIVANAKLSEGRRELQLSTDYSGNQRRTSDGRKKQRSRSQTPIATAKQPKSYQNRGRSSSPAASFKNQSVVESHELITELNRPLLPASELRTPELADIDLQDVEPPAKPHIPSEISVDERPVKGLDASYLALYKMDDYDTGLTSASDKALPVPTSEFSNSYITANPEQREMEAENHPKFDLDPIPNDVLPEYELPISIFGLYLINCFYSKNFTAREYAFSQILACFLKYVEPLHSKEEESQAVTPEVVKCNVHLENFDPLKIVRAGMLFVSKTVIDDREKVCCWGMKMWMVVLEIISKNDIHHSVSFNTTSVLFPTILLRAGDNNIRIHKPATNLALNLVITYQSPPHSLLPLLLKTSHKVVPRHLKARLDIVRQCIDVVGITGYRDKKVEGSGGLDLRVLVNFVDPHLTHTNADVREVAGDIMRQTIKICGKYEVLQRLVGSKNEAYVEKIDVVSDLGLRPQSRGEKNGDGEYHRSLIRPSLATASRTHAKQKTSSTQKNRSASFEKPAAEIGPPLFSALQKTKSKPTSNRRNPVRHSASSTTASLRSSDDLVTLKKNNLRKGGRPPKNEPKKKDIERETLSDHIKKSQSGNNYKSVMGVGVTDTEKASKNFDKENKDIVSINNVNEGQRKKNMLEKPIDLGVLEQIDYDNSSTLISDDWNFERVCIFCEKRDENFTEDVLDEHYWNSCPLLCNCPLCNLIIEVSTLTSHLVDECDYSNRIQQCPICEEAILREDYLAHLQKKDCKELLPGIARCPLCHIDIPDGDAGWRSHLLQSPGCPKANAKRKANETDE